MKPISYLITEGKLTKTNFQTESEKVLRIIRIAVEVGISLIQIREKNLSARFLLDLTKKAVEMRGKSPTKILLNDRVDIAVLAGADGVHLP
ncbi:MAG: thiamine phosphate synthase, partial [Acidobacteria bacterium]